MKAVSAVGKLQGPTRPTNNEQVEAKVMRVEVEKHKLSSAVRRRRAGLRRETVVMGLPTEEDCEEGGREGNNCAPQSP